MAVRGVDGVLSIDKSLDVTTTNSSTTLMNHELGTRLVLPMQPCG